MGEAAHVPPALARWLADRLPEAGPFAWTRLDVGTSNVTYRLVSERHRLILQQPPPVALDRSAHNVARQYRLLHALAGHGTCAPAPVGLCEDPAVLGGPFIVVEAIDGETITTVSCAEDCLVVGEIADSMIDALAAVHAVDWHAAGLDDFGRPDGFLERQVGRWARQYERSRTRDLPQFYEVAGWLERNRPPATAPAVMHGDFHLANCLVALRPRPARVVGVIDWEMATIGDPLLDLGLVLGLWGTDPATPPALPAVQALSRQPGAPARADLAARYAAASGRSVERLDYYIALALWKLAAIMEASYGHHVAGRSDGETGRRMEQAVPRLLAAAAAATRGT